MTTETIPLYTIGFTQRSAESFFETLRRHGVSRLIDVRANNTSQLAGFTKRDDLAYFLREIVGAEYHHLEFLAPTPELREMMKPGGGGWAAYEPRFLALLDERRVIEQLDRTFFTEQPCCLLCSERKAEHCHRRLVAEYLQRAWPELRIVHL
ncbi:DUF488 family protein [Sphaerobacter thermophilus]|uniref:DUF488 domain-containing protein n=1 Tax=Sphaerobacter thermophilus (strain ATCC 49802 / DSM 20745 / KCCM 41009 / NCIMB 13125 / S 6022) TaxID=479434 RepID=D1C4U3_SPHTD|nr:DUF488 domain-containing protein [Sphaerobacter thermophilus]ACZ39260.1 protein of unknown function DUF1130 [Sphaerobacter thermophilus DSM 20745]